MQNLDCLRIVIGADVFHAGFESAKDLHAWPAGNRFEIDTGIAHDGDGDRAIFVGDATMSPYEIVQPGGSIEHWNDEAGAVWLQRLTGRFQRHVWLNPEPEDRWDYTQSIGITRQLVGLKMFPLTLKGLDQGIQALKS